MLPLPDTLAEQVVTIAGTLLGMTASPIGIIAFVICMIFGLFRLSVAWPILTGVMLAGRQVALGWENWVAIGFSRHEMNYYAGVWGAVSLTIAVLGFLFGRGLRWSKDQTRQPKKPVDEHGRAM
jgi:hypothetical protein